VDSFHTDSIGIDSLRSWTNKVDSVHVKKADWLSRLVSQFTRRTMKKNREGTEDSRRTEESKDGRVVTVKVLLKYPMGEVVWDDGQRESLALNQLMTLREHYNEKKKEVIRGNEEFLNGDENSSTAAEVAKSPPVEKLEISVDGKVFRINEFVVRVDGTVPVGRTEYGIIKKIYPDGTYKS
jgi:hypothetical protein